VGRRRAASVRAAPPARSLRPAAIRRGRASTRAGRCVCRRPSSAGAG
jgi:hypothetical protein